MNSTSSTSGRRCLCVGIGSTGVREHVGVQGAKRAIFTDAFLAADSSVGLLVGPQACGKSAVATALARDPEIQVCRVVSYFDCHLSFAAILEAHDLLPFVWNTCIAPNT
jgi:hypothetical protein